MTEWNNAGDGLPGICVITYARAYGAHFPVVISVNPV